jgi:SAM-dependent methyltransferase
MEHVADPWAFMRAVFRCLKPGGVYLFLTPNGRHYFTRTAKTLKALRLDETVLRLVRPKCEIEQYHYPVYYRFNTRSRIDRCAADLGFAPPEYVFTERGGPPNYMPGPLRLIYHLLGLKRRLIHSPDALLEMFCRVTKPSPPS